MNAKLIIIYYITLTILSIPIGYWLASCLKTTESTQHMTWKEYCKSVLVFSFIYFVSLMLLLKFQNYLPLNPLKFSGLNWGLSFNTAASFVTNTNWQAYSGESTLSILSQSLGLTVQNFISASVGLCILAVLIRGFSNFENPNIGNFWEDLKKTTFYFLLPLSIFLSLLLVREGVPQTLNGNLEYKTFESQELQSIPLGMVASQIAIKQLGTNGGGYYNTNSAHPFENPTPFSNFLQCISILLIPAACCHAYGILINDKRQGWSLFTLMLLVSVISTFAVCYFESHSTQTSYLDKYLSNSLNMEGKETRFGITNSSIWSVATTAASNGSVNSMLDSYTPLGGMIPMILMQLGEVIFGGVGSGLYGMICFVIVTVFIAGLMIGRTPEYLGKKIDVYEIKMVSIVILIPCCLVLVGTLLGSNKDSIYNPGPHGFSEILYAYSSMGNNNGSAFGGFASSLPFHLWAGGIIMIISRFFIIIPILALSGSLALKKITPTSTGTLPTHNIFFNILLFFIIIIVGALTFIPALVLGPIIEVLS